MRFVRILVAFYMTIHIYSAEKNSSPPLPTRSTSDEDKASKQTPLDETDGTLLSHIHQRSLSENDLQADRRSGHHYHPRNDGFDMLAVARNFERCMESDEIDMGHYVLAYRELERYTYDEDVVNFLIRGKP